MNAEPRFDRPVPDGGYAWWYVDALSDEDPRVGLAIIGFVGSVFSPYYARSRRRGAADPLDHCAVNVGLYLPRGGYWSMTERPHGSTRRSAAELAVGPSALRWDGRILRIDIDERSVPRLAPLRGSVSVLPEAGGGRECALDPGGRHRWQALAPMARVEVDFERPALRWRGTGYWDCNHGDEPLERAFRSWQWARTHLAGGITAIDYDALLRAGGRTRLHLRIGPDGTRTVDPLAPPLRLPRSAWGIGRAIATDASQARITRGLEDGPFYSRSLVGTTIDGQAVTTMHESLDLDRFASPWVQALLPFRMPRAWRPAPPA